jgi:hypothetical protein
MSSEIGCSPKHHSENVCVIADNCLILRGITHPFASPGRKRRDEFLALPDGTLVKNRDRKME